jgi:hypothetical protein
MALLLVMYTRGYTGHLVTRRHRAFDRIGRDGAGEHDDVDRREPPRNVLRLAGARQRELRQARNSMHQRVQHGRVLRRQPEDLQGIVEVQPSRLTPSVRRPHGRPHADELKIALGDPGGENGALASCPRRRPAFLVDLSR